MIEGLGFAMALQFKPDGKGGFLYRKDQTGAPVPATQHERDHYVRWFGWMVVVGFVSFFAGMIALAFAMNAILPNPTDTQGALGAVLMCVITMGALYFSLRWLSHAPARAFAGRATVS